jgi:hypothetical protein
MPGWNGPRLDVLKPEVGIEDMDGGVDIVQVDDGLPHLVLKMLDSARDLGALPDEGVQYVGLLSPFGH